ncbi:hypothetical protein F2Q70_00030549 [Brassica cretica]|uniref:Uncharacterized protein n=1 Tax=Brassica cretica TaxID=69181 RepID=A0A8S9FLU5_BRACR|nr:hypothetical protein F2Q70_00030549 [Brassica cretica]
MRRTLPISDPPRSGDLVNRPNEISSATSNLHSQSNRIVPQIRITLGKVDYPLKKGQPESKLAAFTGEDGDDTRVIASHTIQ